MTIPNGMSWSQDDKLLYLADTKDRSIYTYDFNADTGSLSNKRLFFLTEEGTGPDGHAQDVDGNIWTAVWGAWKVVKVSPAGRVTAEIKLPTRCVTVSLPPGPCCEFLEHDDSSCRPLHSAARISTLRQRRRQNLRNILNLSVMRVRCSNVMWASAGRHHTKLGWLFETGVLNGLTHVIPSNN